MLHHPQFKRQSTKYSFISTKKFKVILAGWQLRSKQGIFPHNLSAPNILNTAPTEVFTLKYYKINNKDILTSTINSLAHSDDGSQGFHPLPQLCAIIVPPRFPICKIIFSHFWISFCAVTVTSQQNILMQTENLEFIIQNLQFQIICNENDSVLGFLNVFIIKHFVYQDLLTSVPQFRLTLVSPI